MNETEEREKRVRGEWRGCEGREEEDRGKD